MGAGISIGNHFIDFKVKKNRDNELKFSYSTVYGYCVHIKNDLLMNLIHITCDIFIYTLPVLLKNIENCTNEDASFLLRKLNTSNQHMNKLRSTINDFIDEREVWFQILKFPKLYFEYINKSKLVYCKNPILDNYTYANLDLDSYNQIFNKNRNSIKPNNYSAVTHSTTQQVNSSHYPLTLETSDTRLIGEIPTDKSYYSSIHNNLLNVFENSSTNVKYSNKETFGSTLTSPFKTSKSSLSINQDHDVNKKDIILLTPTLTIESNTNKSQSQSHMANSNIDNNPYPTFKLNDNEFDDVSSLISESKIKSFRKDNAKHNDYPSLLSYSKNQSNLDYEITRRKTLPAYYHLGYVSSPNATPYTLYSRNAKLPNSTSSTPKTPQRRHKSAGTPFTPIRRRRPKYKPSKVNSQVFPCIKSSSIYDMNGEIYLSPPCKTQQFFSSDITTQESTPLGVQATPRIRKKPMNTSLTSLNTSVIKKRKTTHTNINIPKGKPLVSIAKK